MKTKEKIIRTLLYLLVATILIFVSTKVHSGILTLGAGVMIYLCIATWSYL